MVARRMEARAQGDDPGQISGYAALFDTPTQIGGDKWGFEEVIAKGAFNDVLGDDVRCLFNHDRNLVLGRTASKTLSLRVDATGLHYEVQLPPTAQARDLAALVQRGDVSESSFAFRVAEDAWEHDEDGDRTKRTILKVAALLDVSPVTHPAYAGTTVAAS